MAIHQFVVDRYKAEGFFRYIEWTTSRGMLMCISEVKKDGTFNVEFASGEFDSEYDQKVEGSRQRFITYTESIRIMLQWNFTPKRIEKIFRDIKTYGIVREVIQ